MSAGREQALAQIGRGADVIFQNADAAGLGVFQAARETKKALVVGSNSNQNAVAPEITIASVVIDLPHAFLTVAREVKSKTFKPRLIRLGTESDVVTLVVNPAFQFAHPTRCDARRRFGSRESSPPAASILVLAAALTHDDRRARMSARRRCGDISTQCCAPARCRTTAAR